MVFSILIIPHPGLHCSSRHVFDDVEVCHDVVRIPHEGRAALVRPRVGLYAPCSRPLTVKTAEHRSTCRILSVADVELDRGRDDSSWQQQPSGQTLSEKDPTERFESLSGRVPGQRPRPCCMQRKPLLRSTRPASAGATEAPTDLRSLIRVPHLALAGARAADRSRRARTRCWAACNVR